jgi:hypothetical protein
MTHGKGNARLNLSYVFPKESEWGIRKLQKKYPIVFIYESKKKKKYIYIYIYSNLISFTGSWYNFTIWDKICIDMQVAEIIYII